MSAKTIKTQSEEKHRYSVHLDKARQFYDTMREAQASGRWAAVGLNAVHCAISVNDALTVFFLQERSAGEDHLLAAELLSRVPLDDVDSQKTNFRRIIAKKNAIAYEGRHFRQKEAEDISKQAERFYQWGIQRLPL
jgi:hypothetical protein